MIKPSKRKRSDGPESTETFRQRIAAMLRDPDALEPILGAKKSNPALVRGPRDRGYYPPRRKRS